MDLIKSRAHYVILAIVLGGVIVLGGLHWFSDHGQFAPASMTGGATKSDQRDSAVSNDVARHKGQ